MTKNNKKGFTIIEVVLVLAIAGLIFLMVFIALPALQRSQRNTQREDDLARILTGVNNFQANNSGKTPFQGGTGNADRLESFVTRYIDRTCQNRANAPQGVQSGITFDSCGAEFSDPQGNPYYIGYGGDGETAPADGMDIDSDIPDTSTGVYGFTGYSYASCGEEARVVRGTGDRDVAVFMRLEGGAVACNDNH